jgi:hypothetical protein
MGRRRRCDREPRDGVDGLHQRAGSANVIELHGTLSRSRCTSASCEHAQAEDLTQVIEECPKCPRCGAFLRPDVVLFKEALSGGVEYLAKRSLRECDALTAVPRRAHGPTTARKRCACSRLSYTTNVSTSTTSHAAWSTGTSTATWLRGARPKLAALPSQPVSA